MPLLVVRFESPKHGWLPVNLQVAGIEFDFAGSDILNNPLEDLVEALQTAASGRESSVRWFLEPGFYWFEFLPTASSVELRVSLGETASGSDRELKASFVGSRAEVLLPFWRAVRRVATERPKKPHWTPLDEKRIDDVGGLLRAES